MDIQIEQGEFVAIVGKSGFGKSTLLHMLGGLDTPTKGSVTLAGKDLYRMKEDALLFSAEEKSDLFFRHSIWFHLLTSGKILYCHWGWLVEQGNLVSTGTGPMGAQNQQVPLFSLPVMLLCIFVSFLTVVLALRKPMKIVSRIPSIEATRYLENEETQKKENEMAEKMSPCFLWQWQM